MVPSSIFNKLQLHKLPCLLNRAGMYSQLLHVRFSASEVHMQSCIPPTSHSPCFGFPFTSSWPSIQSKGIAQLARSLPGVNMAVQSTLRRPEDPLLALYHITPICSLQIPPYIPDHASGCNHRSALSIISSGMEDTDGCGGEQRNEPKAAAFSPKLWNQR